MDLVRIIEWAVYMDLVQSSYGLCTALVRTSYGSRMVFVRIAYGLRMRCLWTSCELSMDFAYASRVRISNALHMFHCRVRTRFLPNSVGLRTVQVCVLILN